MNLRKLLGLPVILSAQESLEIEIKKAEEAKQRILIYGYDKEIIEDGSFMQTLTEAAKKGIEVGVILHEKDPKTKLDGLIDLNSNIKIHRSRNRFLINEGFRTYDNKCGFYYNKKAHHIDNGLKESYRFYIDGFTNLPLRRTYDSELKSIKHSFNS